MSCSIEKHMWCLRVGSLRETKFLLRLYKQFDYFFFVFVVSLSSFFFPKRSSCSKRFRHNNNNHGIDKMEFDVDGGGGVSWQCCKVWTSPTKFLTATKQKNTLKIWLQEVCTHTHTHTE